METQILTQNEFFKRECARWGEDEIYDLIDRGFVPTLIGTKWVWRMIPLNVTDRVTSAIST